MKKVVVAASLFLVFASAVYAAETWEKLREEAGNFTISLPGKPQKHTQTVDTEVGKVEAIYYLLELNKGKTVYAVAYSDYPKDFADNANVDEVLDGVRNGNIKPHAGTVTEEFSIKLDGHSGREYQFQGKLHGTGDAINGHVRLFLVGARLYQLIVLSSPDAPEPKENIGRFFYSFDRTKK